MARRARMAGRARGARRAACRKRRSSPWRAGWPRPIRWCWRRATVWNAAATAAAASARRSRCRRCSASWATAAASPSVRATRFRRPWRSCSGPTWRRPGTRTLNLVDIGRHLDERRHRPAAARGVHLQPQSDRRASGPEPHAPRPGARRGVHGRHRRCDDRKHGALRHRAAGGDQFRMRRPVSVLRPSLAATGRAGDRATGRIAAEHRNLPPPGRAFRLRRAVLQGDRRRADGRCDRSRRSAARRRPSERAFPPRRRMQMRGPDGAPLVLFENVFPATPSGKVELVSETLGPTLGRRGADRRPGESGMRRSR